MRPAVSCYFATDAIVWGYGQISVNGRLLVSDEFMPEYVGRVLDLDSGGCGLPDALLAHPTDTYGRESLHLVLMSYGTRVYGHFLY